MILVGCHCAHWHIFALLILWVSMSRLVTRDQNREMSSYLKRAQIVEYSLGVGIKFDEGCVQLDVTSMSAS